MQRQISGYKQANENKICQQKSVRLMSIKPDFNVCHCILPLNTVK